MGMTKPVEPQFISSRPDPGTAAGRRRAMREMQAQQVAGGAVFFRYSLDDRYIWLEGWEVIPDNPAPFEPLYTYAGEAA